MQATKQAMIAREHDPRVAATIFFLDLRAQGKGFDRYYERAKEVHGVRYIRSMVSRVTQDPRTANLEITYVDEENRRPERRIRPGDPLGGPGLPPRHPGFGCHVRHCHEPVGVCREPAF